MDIKKELLKKIQARGLQPTTKKQYLSQLNLLKQYCPEGKLTAKSLRDYLEGGRNRNNYLSKAFVKLISEITKLPVHIEKKTGSVGKHRELEWYTDEQFSKLIRKVKEHKNIPVYVLLMVGRQAGLRKIEVLRIQKKHINFETGQVRIRGKGDKYRTVIIKGKPLKIMAAKLKGKGDEEYLLVPKKDYTYPEWFNFQIYKYCRQAGTPKSCPHVICRHSFATNLRKKGVKIELVQKALGHTNIENTMIYSHIGDEEMQDVWRIANKK